MTKRCMHCGRYFTPDKRIGQRQKVCKREQCKRARKKQAQQQWQQNNPTYFDNLYLDYVKPWRQRRKELRAIFLGETSDKRRDTRFKTFTAAGSVDTG